MKAKRFFRAAAAAGSMLLAGATAAAAQDAPAVPDGPGFVMESGAPAYMSDEPVGSIGLSPEQRLSLRTYQYRSFGAPGTGRSHFAMGYQPSREGDLDATAIEGLDDLSEAWDTGGIVQYGYSDPDDPRTRAGIDVRIAPGDINAGDGWLLQPGASYTTPFLDRWQFNARVYSTIAPPSSSSGGMYLDRQSRNSAAWNTDSTFQDVGVNLGLAYDVNDSWILGTGAGVSRMLGRPDEAARLDDEPAATQFFGGVVLKYKF
ncbi:MAG TPA: MipA/OmpV family protein [Rhodospirillales bacterium]|nr:MipA/OmpV family protein [Rhodospirillales bacterium]